VYTFLYGVYSYVYQKGYIMNNLFYYTVQDSFHRQALQLALLNDSYGWANRMPGRGGGWAKESDGWYAQHGREMRNTRIIAGVTPAL